MLVVVGIITLLVALLTAAVQRVRVNAQVHASEDIVIKLQQALDNQREAIVTQVGTERRNQTQEFSALLGYANGDPDRAEALMLYCRLRQAFPQTASELSMTSFGLGSPPVWTYYRPKHFDAIAGIAGGNDEVSAAILYAIGSRAGTGGAGFTGQATEGAETEINLGKTVRVYKDSFGKPVGFYRFGTNPELQAPPYLNPKPGAASKDPFDPQAKLYNSGQEWVTGANNRALAIQALFVNNGDPANATRFGPPGSDNRIPVVYSAGANKQYEMLVPNSDDILGYRLRKIGQKGGGQ
jgi:hypothetical protein